MAHLMLVRNGDYVAVTAYVERTAERERLLREIRTAIRDRFGVATTVGYGPRFLHSTGQLHKGGAANGVFLQLSAEPANDLPIPGEPFTFSVLEAAQALGDYESLASRGRRALRVSLGADVDTGLRTILAVVTEKPAKRAATKAKSKPKAKAASKSVARKTRSIARKTRGAAKKTSARRAAKKTSARGRRGR
jgi:hypothetical protein